MSAADVTTEAARPPVPKRGRTRRSKDTAATAAEATVSTGTVKKAASGG